MPYRKITTETFIDRLKEIFQGEDYDYSKVVYQGMKEKVTCHCNKHNIDFTKQANTLLLGCGCHLCGRSGHKYSTEEWKILAEKEWPEYDFSNSIYKNKETQIEVICHKKDKDGIEHGSFYILPKRLLKHDGYCPKCTKEKNFEERKKKALEQIRDFYKDRDYDLSHIIYKDKHTPIRIICNKHKIEFRPTISNILSHKCICPECAKEECKDKIRLTYNETIKRLKDKHPELDFSLYTTQQENTNDYIRVICHHEDEKGNEHGIFSKTLHALLGGQGCPKCSFEKRGKAIRKKEEVFLKEAQEIHYGKNWDYSKCHYTKLSDKVVIVCNETDKYGNKHGEFKVTAANLLSGNGCPKCNSSHLEQKVRSALLKSNIKFEEQKHFGWLGKQSLDFYLPEQKKAIECQGSQHFINYEKWSCLEKVKERDEIKRRRCEENNVTLVYFFEKYFNKFAEDITNQRFNYIEDLIKYLEESRPCHNQ